MGRSLKKDSSMIIWWKKVEVAHSDKKVVVVPHQFSQTLLTNNTYDGSSVPAYIQEDMVEYKLGEFAPTRTNGHNDDKKSKWITRGDWKCQKSHLQKQLKQFVLYLVKPVLSI